MLCRSTLTFYFFFPFPFFGSSSGSGSGSGGGGKYVRGGPATGCQSLPFSDTSKLTLVFASSGLAVNFASWPSSPPVGPFGGMVIMLWSSGIAAAAVTAAAASSCSSPTRRPGALGSGGTAKKKDSFEAGTSLSSQTATSDFPALASSQGCSGSVACTPPFVLSCTGGDVFLLASAEGGRTGGAASPPSAARGAPDASSAPSSTSSGGGEDSKGSATSIPWASETKRTLNHRPKFVATRERWWSNVEGKGGRGGKERFSPTFRENFSRSRLSLIRDVSC